MTKAETKCTTLALLISTACAGSSGSLPRCNQTSECASGLVCLVPVGGEQGVCGSPPFGVGLVAPAAGAKVGKAGVTVTVQVTIAGPDGSLPDDVRMVVNGVEGSSLPLAGQDGAIVTYQGRYTPGEGSTSTATLWAVAKTSAGSVHSDAVVLLVDTKPPEILFLPDVSCSSCSRDQDVRVTVQTSDDHAVSVEAAIDLDGYASPVQLTSDDGRYHAGKIPLKDLPFPSFSGSATVRLRARDEYGNETVRDLRPFTVTRLRWVYDAKADGVTSPAVDADGTVVIGVAGTTQQLRGISPADGYLAWWTTPGTKGVTAAPSIGPSAIWLGSEDGNLYWRDAHGTYSFCPGLSEQTTGSLYTPAIRLDPSEAAFTGGSAKYLYGAAPGRCLSPARVSTVDAVTTSPVIAGGKVFVATATASVRRFTASLQDDGLEITPFGDGVYCSDIAVPMAVAANGQLVLACGIAQGKSQVHLLDPVHGSSSYLATLPSKPAESIVILPNGDLVVGTNDGKVHRLAPPAGGTGPWVDAWTPPPDLGAGVTGVLVAAPEAGGRGAVVYAVTAAGDLHALDAKGATVWSTAGAVSAPLGSFSLSFPTIAPALPGGLPTLYVGSAEGKLYAVVVDTGLEVSSPWPKSHHDIRNTGNASAPLP